MIRDYIDMVWEIYLLEWQLFTDYWWQWTLLAIALVSLGIYFEKK